MFEMIDKEIKLGIGSVLFGMDYGFDQQLTKSKIHEILNFAKKNNVLFVDTAREYGDSEKAIGHYMSETGQSFFVSTKFQKIKPNHDIEQSINVSISESKQNLKKDIIDLVSLHQTDDFLIENTLLWDLIRDLKRQNIIQNFGVSIYEPSDLINIVSNQHKLIDYVQLPFNLLNRLNESIFNDLKKFDVKIVVRSVFMRGLLAQEVKDIEIDEIKASLNKLYDLNPHLTDVPLKELAFNYVYHHPLIDYVIVGIKDTIELRELLEFSKKPPLQINYLNELNIDMFYVDPRNW